MSCTSMTITRPYFEMIYQGVKKIEYRRDCPRNKMTMEKKPKIIYFHYRKGLYLKTWVKRISLIKKPAKLHLSKFITTEKCYAIHIEKTLLMDKNAYDIDKEKTKKQ